MRLFERTRVLQQIKLLCDPSVGHIFVHGFYFTHTRMLEFGGTDVAYAGVAGVRII